MTAADTGAPTPELPTPPFGRSIADAWTTERIREAFIDDGGLAEYHDPINGAAEHRRIAGAIFDAWLEAHDAALKPTDPADLEDRRVRAVEDILAEAVIDLDEIKAYRYWRTDQTLAERLVAAVVGIS